MPVMTSASGRNARLSPHLRHCVFSKSTVFSQLSHMKFFTEPPNPVGLPSAVDRALGRNAKTPYAEEEPLIPERGPRRSDLHSRGQRLAPWPRRCKAQPAMQRSSRHDLAGLFPFGLRPFQFVGLGTVQSFSGILRCDFNLTASNKRLFFLIKSLCGALIAFALIFKNRHLSIGNVLLPHFILLADWITRMTRRASNRSRSG